MSGGMEERREELVALVNAQGSVSLREIKQVFPDVSEVTIRTDLKALDAEHRIIRVHGGARSVGQIIGTDDLIDSRAARCVQAKALIAQKAASLVRPDSTLFLDSGSTTTAFARVIPDQRSIVFTNSLTCVTELARLGNVAVRLIGGALNRYSLSLNGGSAVEAIRSISYDQLFLGVTGFQLDRGVMCGSDDEAALKRALIERADRVIALMDSTKVGRRSTFHVCDLDDIDVVVSDGNLPDDFLRACEDARVEVL